MGQRVRMEIVQGVVGKGAGGVQGVTGVGRL